MNKPTYSPVKNYIVPITSILRHDAEQIKRASDALQKRGYIFVRLPVELVKQIDICLSSIELFFNGSIQYKKKFFKAPIFGYFNANHKESFRMLTGTRMNEQNYPQYFDSIKDLVHTVDQLMYSLTISLSSSLFPNILTESRKLDIPFFEMSNKQWGMFDIARYLNDGTRKRINCEEHYDPGLLSLSLRSTQPGLELKDEFEKWIKAPLDKNIAILWAGKAATVANPKIKPCIHRVTNPLVPGRPRIAIWHEICTTAQEHKELLKKNKTKEVAKVNPFKYESELGIPMSKSSPDTLIR